MIITIGAWYLFHKEKKISHHPIYVVSFNILAPCWASPSYYPAPVASHLDRIKRRAHILKFLNSMIAQTDIFMLQETTQPEFTYFKHALQDYFYAFPAYHESQYWSDWRTADTPFEPNGVAIFVKRSSFSHINFQDLALSQDGNHSAYFEGIQQNSGIKVRAVSVHFDSEQSSNRNHELKALLKLMPNRVNTVDIIAGDFNFDTERGTIKRYLDRNNFVDVLKQLNKAEWTHPFYANGNKNDGILDHIVTRHSIPIDGQVVHSNLWKQYPSDETQRIIANLDITGSDHFPIWGVVDNKKP